MYIRYRAKYYNTQTQKEGLGFFWAVDHLIKHGDLSKEDRIRVEFLSHFFDHNLPIPDYYQEDKNRQAAKSATSWFKDSSEKFIKLMNELAVILEKHQVDVERIFSKKLQGKKIYEDNFQVVILPFRDVKDKVI